MTKNLWRHNELFFYLLHFLFSFCYVVISLVVYCTDEIMKAETRLQLTKNYYVTVVFLPQ